MDSWKLAQEAAQFSYSPYSQKKVGACIVLDNQKVYTGTNIENASFGATVCAERVALWKAVSENKTLKIEAVYVYTPANPPWSPCGICRQVLSEFAAPTTLVYLCNDHGVHNKFSLQELLPEAFAKKDLSS